MKQLRVEDQGENGFIATYVKSGGVFGFLGGKSRKSVIINALKIHDKGKLKESKPESKRFSE